MASLRANLVNHLFLKIRIAPHGDAVTQNVICIYVILCVMSIAVAANRAAVDALPVNEA